MPIPEPKSGEEKNDFISRCMGDDTMVDEYEQEQRAAICYSKWREKNESLNLDFRSLVEDVRNLVEKNQYEVYHRSYTDAVNEIRNFVSKMGYEVDDDDMFRIVGSGPRKPSSGKTNSFLIPLYRNGKEAMKKVEVQIYNTGQSYELNLYMGKATKDMY